jgi:hypothetical protein
MNQYIGRYFFLGILLLAVWNRCSAMDSPQFNGYGNDEFLSCLPSDLLAAIGGLGMAKLQEDFAADIESIVDDTKQVRVPVDTSCTDHSYDSDATEKSHESTPFQSPSAAPLEAEHEVPHFTLPSAAPMSHTMIPAPLHWAPMVFHPIEMWHGLPVKILSPSDLFFIKINTFLVHSFLTPQQHFHFLTALRFMNNGRSLDNLWLELYSTLANKFNALARKNYGTDQLGFDPHTNLLQSIKFYKHNFFAGCEQYLASMEEEAQEYNPATLPNFYNYLQVFFSSQDADEPEELPLYEAQEKIECGALPAPRQLDETEYPLHINTIIRWHPAQHMMLAHALRIFLTPRTYALLMCAARDHDPEFPNLILAAFSQSSEYCSFLANPS